MRVQGASLRMLHTFRISRRRRLSFVLIAPLAIIAACAATHYAPQDTTALDDVPFFKQEDFQCGPAALATVINYWYQRGKTSCFVTPDEIVSDIYSPSAQGVLGLDLELLARRLGFDVQQYSGSLDDIKKKIDQSVPLILLVDYGFRAYQINHFMVITGYSEEGVVAHSGRRRNEYISKDKLERIWGRTGFWTLAIRPLP